MDMSTSKIALKIGAIIRQVKKSDKSFNALQQYVILQMRARCKKPLIAFLTSFDFKMTFSVITFFYLNRRKHCFCESFRFPVFDGFRHFGMS